jgi:hypothetical protein
MDIQVPYKFIPRDYQLPFWQAMDSGIKRGLKVWHRRAGKDKNDLNFMIKKMFERKGLYLYYYPTMTLGRKALWDGMDRDGFPFIGHIPADAIDGRPNNQEMRIRLRNGSIFQVVGTDRLEVVGPNPVGVCFSEFSKQNPRGWEYVRPILRENGGWAVFNFTPRGKNHAYDLYKMATTNPRWFCQKLTIEDTGVVTPEDVEQDRIEGMTEDMIQQEYYCSFDLGVEGSYYSKYMSIALTDGRMAIVPYDESTPVFTFWDLGVSDATAIWFVQFVGKEIHLIDYYENVGESITHYIKTVKEKDYYYGQHFAPHDVIARHLSTGGSTFDMAHKLGFQFEIMPKPPSIQEGIELARSILRQCWFDDKKCRRGIDCLENYRKEYNEKTRAYSTKPRHDEFSNGADAFRILATAYRQGMINSADVKISTRLFTGYRKKLAKGYDVLNHGLAV